MATFTPSILSAHAGKRRAFVRLSRAAGEGPGGAALMTQGKSKFLFRLLSLTDEIKIKNRLRWKLRGSLVEFKGKPQDG